MDLEKPGVLDIWSIVSAKDGKPYVQFKYGKDEDPLKFQLSPDEAREHANKITEVAFAADADAFLVDFLTKKIGVEMSAAVGLLKEFREWREKK
jgi:hypothetical protein